MRASQFLLITQRQDPADAEAASHRWLVRAGMVRQVAAGIYNWLPLGLRVLQRVERIIREEMDAAGFQELLMPFVQPGELWRESGRWEKYGPELLRIKDRHDREFCLGPTHEEIITDLVRNEIRSHKRMPLCLYQIQTKFRDEIRPRFGILRGREFLMKDAYSFHMDEDCLDKTYERVRQVYERILRRLGLRYEMVAADSGAIGGDVSHEFHVLADSGEDQIAYCEGGGHAANIEAFPCPPPEGQRPRPNEQCRVADTPGERSIQEVAHGLRLPASKCLKALVVRGSSDKVVALAIRGDHTLNRVKAERLPEVAAPLTMASAEEMAEAGLVNGFIGPQGLQVPLIADHAAAFLSDFVCGANAADKHLVGANWGRDMPEPAKTADIRNISHGELSPDGKRVTVTRGIEVGHIFKLGTRYSSAMKTVCMDAAGEARTLTMGCYGMGVSRLVAASIEQHHDERGIVWPDALAPFTLALLPLNMHKSQRLREAAEKLYESLKRQGYEVLFDDRKERPGVMYTDCELTGVPHWLILSESGLDENRLEYRPRNSKETQKIGMDSLQDFLRQKLQGQQEGQDA